MGECLGAVSKVVLVSLEQRGLRWRRRRTGCIVGVSVLADQTIGAVQRLDSNRRRRQ